MKSPLFFQKSALGLILIAALAGPAFAKAPLQVIHVSLGGEAGQPMTIKLDKADLKAGSVEFDVTNDAIGTDHEAVLVRLKSKDQVITADIKKHRVDEAKLDSLGEVAGLAAGKTKMLKVSLKAGEYAFICNHKTHYEAGMWTRFTVVK